MLVLYGVKVEVSRLSKGIKKASIFNSNGPDLILVGGSFLIVHYLLVISSPQHKLQSSFLRLIRKRNTVCRAPLRGVTTRTPVYVSTRVRT